MIDFLSNITGFSELFIVLFFTVICFGSFFIFFIFSSSLGQAYRKQQSRELAQKFRLEYVSEVFTPEPELAWFFRHLEKSEYYNHMRGQSKSGIQFELFDHKSSRFEQRKGRTVEIKTILPARVLAIRCTNPNIPEFRLTPPSLNTVGYMWGSAYRGDIDEAARQTVLQGYEIKFLGSQTSFFDQFPEEGLACINPHCTIANCEQGWFIWQDQQSDGEKMIRQGLKFYKYLEQHAQQFKER